jgi:hypothetical protein
MVSVPFGRKRKLNDALAANGATVQGTATAAVLVGNPLHRSGNVKRSDYDQLQKRHRRTLADKEGDQ